jgi:superfamily II DNA/RNA helicase
LTTFSSIGVRPRTADVLLKNDISEPNTVQREAIPALLQRRDCVLQAPTGSGKTLAFVIPMVERLAGHYGHGARALIVTPTRELAGQVASVIKMVDPALRVVLCIGGVGYGPQLSGLRNAPDVIVGCPGRILDLASSGSARLRGIEYLVLDEADEMLDQGFAKDVEQIIALCPSTEGGVRRQTVLASATIPAWVQQMIAKHLQAPVRINITDEQLPTLEHGVLSVVKARKIEALSKLLRRQRGSELNQTIVFHRTKHGAKKLVRDLTRIGHTASELQGNLSQNARDREMEAFRANETEVLVATNVAARGIDVVNVGLVINFELPETPQWLTHRIGRTARNGAAGKAITFISEEDDEKWRKLRRLGAPALPLIDADLLLGSGQWKLGPAPAEEPSARPRLRVGPTDPRARMRRRRRSRPAAMPRSR